MTDPPTAHVSNHSQTNARYGRAHRGLRPAAVMGAAGDSGFNLDPFDAHQSGNVSRVESHINSFLQLDEAAAAQDINNSSVLRVCCLATAAGP